MKEKNNQKGFIQIPILIAIIIGATIISVGGYFGVGQYKNYQLQKVEKEKLAQESKELSREKEEQTQELTKIQQEALEKIQQESEKLTQQLLEEKEKMKQETERIQQQQRELEQKIREFEAKNTATEKNANTTIQITPEDLEAYRYDVGQVHCYGTDYSSGSGSLWEFTDLSGIYILTNRHVITTNNCDVSLKDKEHEGSMIGRYELDTDNILIWNEESDIALLKILRVSVGLEKLSDPISTLSSNISSLAFCEKKAFIGSAVAVGGYPAFAEKTVEIPGGNLTGSKSFQAITEGTVSAHDTSVMWPYGNLPYYNYFVSAKIDAGNSGGIAFSKNQTGLCILGVPTWLSVGVYETQGLVQNIHNVMYKE